MKRKKRRLPRLEVLLVPVLLKLEFGCLALGGGGGGVICVDAM